MLDTIQTLSLLTLAEIVGPIGLVYGVMRSRHGGQRQRRTGLPGDPPGELEIVEGAPEGGKIHKLTGVPSAFTPDYAQEEMFEIATRLYEKSR
jgi:hypothetical protein